MLSINLKGGLGNQLFQIAAGETISAETGRTFCLNPTSPKTVHTDTNYFTNVLSEWSNYPQLQHPYTLVYEPSFEKQDWSSIRERNICIDGYFQNWRYVSPSFRNKLHLPPQSPLSGAFLHIRGGDYVNHHVHDIGLAKSYYQHAVDKFPTGTHFYVFTNDIPYAKQFPILQSIPHTIVESDDMTALSQMASCTLGGICANSSFSWWGAYLNPNRTIVMPNKWFNDPSMYIEGYYFPGAQRCTV